jgi:gliding motility associated protien GldN
MYKFSVLFLVFFSCSLSFAQKAKGKKTKKSVVAPSTIAAKPASSSSQDLAQRKSMEEEEKRKLAEAERQRRLAEFEAKIKRVIAPDNKNKYSVRPILDKDIMFRKSVVRRLDMKEKQNRNFMSSNKELPTLILEYIKYGKIKPYASDSLDEGRVFTEAEFMSNLADPNNVMPDTTGMSKEDIKQILGQDRSINTKLLTLVDLKEDVIFDRKRSRVYYDIQSLTVYIPASINPRGFDQRVATVKYKELVEVFKKDNRAIWFNRENDSEHRNFSDAFDLRLFSSFIVKVSSPTDELIVDTYGGDAKKGRFGSEKAALDLMEFEHNLWEF